MAKPADLVQLTILAAQSQTIIQDLTPDEWIRLFEGLKRERIWSVERVTYVYNQIEEEN